MAELRLKTVRIRNWARMADVHLELPEYGLVAVTGTNRASNGRMASVGSGKTALGEALSYTLFGNTGRFTNAKECSREPGGNTYVVVEATFRGQPLVVECGYKCEEMNPTGEALRYTYAGKPHERGHPRQTRADLAALLGVTPLMASWTVFLDGDAIRFGQLPQDERVELLMECLRQPRWAVHHEHANTVARELRRVVAENTGALNAARSVKTTAEDDLQAALAALEQSEAQATPKRERLERQIATDRQTHGQLMDQVTAADARRGAIKAEIDALTESLAAKQHAAEISINEARDARHKLTESRRTLEAKHRAAEAAKAGPEAQLETLLNVPETCPTCGRNWHKKPGADAIQKAQQAVEAAEKVVAKAAKAVEDIEQKIAEADQLIAQRQSALTALGGRQKISELSNETAGLERTTRRLLQQAADLVTAINSRERAVQQVQTEVDAARQRVGDCERNITRAVDAEQEAASSLAENQAALASVEYWCHAFSPVGIPNRVLRSAVEPLNHEARRVSQVLTGGTMEVRFNTSRRKVSGDMKPELTVAVTNRIGGSRLEMNSKGENGLANLIVVETLAAIGRVSDRIGFRWYDEVLPNQDSRVVQSVYARLREIADEKRVLIFLVDHSAHAASYATYTLNVTKAGEGSKCVSTVAWL